MSNENPVLKTGKLPGPLLQNLIEGLPKSEADKRLLVGPGLGEDARTHPLRRKHHPRKNRPYNLHH